jgi:DNA-binding transcriptional ArsR family regulator
MDSDGGDADIAAVARLFGDDTRAAFCIALLDGRFWTAGELARGAEVAASTASEHLAQLVAGGVLEVVSQGRHRYFRLASPEIAAALEALAVVSPAARVRTLRQDVASRALRNGRTCYDHLAGRLGVALTDALIGAGVITADFRPGDFAVLAPLGIVLPLNGARPIVRPCVDWTQRRYHAAGVLPAELTQRLLELGWLSRTERHRAVRLTETGQQGISDLLHISIFAIRGSAS